MMTTLFAYGTLKRGSWNHDRFCGGFVDAQEGFVRGRLFEMESGIPILMVPEADILAHGTGDPLNDVEMESRINKNPDCDRMIAGACGPDEWGKVYGEIFRFDNAGSRLPMIDRLEGFNPDGHSFYHRVLVPAYLEDGASITVWAYIGDVISRPWRILPDGKWESKR